VANVLCVSGLLALAWGLWLLHPAAAPIGLGTLSILAGINLYRSRTKEAKK
jgi:hypothetical protein